MKIKLSTDTTIDLDKLIESRLLIQANSGGGKSWAIRRLIEQAFGHVQIIVIDPEGEFGNLRSKYDFVYAGKDGDAPVESRSASLLARRLLELKASAIVDLYELPPQERKHFVRLFCETMVNAPKELWHDVLVIIDEAHVFAPEKGESEAMGAVIDLATRGRKRGYCVVFATQRLPKLNKDAAAECNNKLIGRASQDIDRKRAAEELGFTTKEAVLSLRDLLPGEFYAFGPAISREVQKITIGEVEVKPAKRGVSKQTVAAPSDAIKKILGQLADLPQEAVKEAKTISELKAEIFTLKRQHQQKIVENGSKEVEKPIGVSQWMNWGAKFGYDKFFEERILKTVNQEWESRLRMANKEIGRLGNILFQIFKLTEKEQSSSIVAGPTKTVVVTPEMMKDVKLDVKVDFDSFYSESPASFEDNPSLKTGARKILHMLVMRHPDKLRRSQLGTLVGFKASGGSFNTYISTLRTQGLIETSGDLIGVTDAGLKYPLDEGLPQTPEERRSMWRDRLKTGAQKMFDVIVDIYPEKITREELGIRVGSVHTGGSFNTYLSTMKSAGLIEVIGPEIRANDNLF